MKTLISHTITLLSFITAITVSQLCLAEQQPSAVVVSFQDRETGEQSSIKASINDKQGFSRSAKETHQQAHIQGKLKADQQGYIAVINQLIIMASWSRWIEALERLGRA